MTRRRRKARSDGRSGGTHAPRLPIQACPRIPRGRVRIRTLPSADRVIRTWRFAALAAHDPVEGSKIGARLAFGEEFARGHRRQLLGNCGGDELVHADAVLFCAFFDLRLDRAGQAQRIRALTVHPLILRIASAGVSTSIPNVAGTLPKSRRLNVTIAAAWPFTAASRTNSSAGSRN